MIPKHAIQLLDQIAQMEEKASPWEKKFIKSIRDQATSGRSLSMKQQVILEKIYAKTTGGGDHQPRERIG